MEPTILVAEDDESVRRMISRVLEITGYTTVQTSTWHDTTAQCAAFRPSLLLLDLKLLPPGGWRALRELQRGPDPIPVVGMSTWPAHPQKTVPSGLEAVLEKPLDLGMLIEKIEALLRPANPVPA